MLCGSMGHRAWMRIEPGVHVGCVCMCRMLNYSICPMSGLLNLQGRPLQPLWRRWNSLRQCLHRAFDFARPANDRLYSVKSICEQFRSLRAAACLRKHVSYVTQASSKSRCAAIMVRWYMYETNSLALSGKRVSKTWIIVE